MFSGSIFEGAPHPPTVLLKLIYHWACQTNVQNVVQWVKVDNFYVKNFFTNMRSVCTAAIHEKYEKMGGLKKRVEVRNAVLLVSLFIIRIISLDITITLFLYLITCTLEILHV